MRHDKSNQHEAANEEDAGRNKVRPQKIYPPAGDSWNAKYQRDDQGAFAICDGNDASKQHEGKQNRYNQFATSNFFDKRGTDEEQGERNEKLDGGEATES